MVPALLNGSLFLDHHDDIFYSHAQPSAPALPLCTNARTCGARQRSHPVVSLAARLRHRRPGMGARAVCPVHTQAETVPTGQWVQEHQSRTHVACHGMLPPASRVGRDCWYTDESVRQGPSWYFYPPKKKVTQDRRLRTADAADTPHKPVQTLWPLGL